MAPALLAGLMTGGTTASPEGGGARLRAHRSAAEWASVPGDATAAPGDTGPVRADTVREYHGLYETGFEVSWFHACDAQPGDDTWWVTLTNDALRQRDSLTKTLTGHPRRLFVRWRATVGPKMPAGAGHMARGSRYMLVTQIISLRASDEKGCTSA